MSDFRLKVFCSAARQLSFTKTSEELFVSQPAVSRHIKELETEYGIRLFERTGGHLILTPAGRIFLKLAEGILESYNALKYEMNCLQGDFSGYLRIGASTTIAQYVLPKVLADFSARYPSISLSLMNGNSTEIEEALCARTIDLGLVEGNTHRPDLHYIPFLCDELVAVTRSNGKYAHKEEINIQELSRMNLALREHGSGTLAVLISALSARQLKLSSFASTIHLGSTESIKRFLLYTDAVGIISIRAVFEELSQGRMKIIEIKDMPMQRMFDLVHRQGQESGLAKEFMHYLECIKDNL